MADPNTRQGKRTPVTLKIKFKSETLEQFIERYAVDVSQGGIFIRTKEPLAVGTQMRFEFQLRDASPLIGGEGTVVWTRENDPSRPAIAPGMGVRFDRLAEGSQAVLERILAEKAKQAPQRSNTESTKPPMFADTPTRVAPLPVQERLLNDDKTPLPQPTPFHSDADDFPNEAFEEATKVRALDDLIAQTAEGSADQLPAAPPPSRTKSVDKPAARPVVPQRIDTTMSEDPTVQLPETQDPSAPSGTQPGFAAAKAAVERDSAPVLPSPPDVKAPRLLDTTPSPKPAVDPMEKFAKTKIGMEPVAAATRGAQATPPAAMPVATPVPRDAPTRPSGIPAAATPVVAESTSAARLPAQKKSAAPMIILILVILAAAGAGVWFFVLREKAVEENTVKRQDPGSGSQVAMTGSDGSGSAGATGSGSDTGSAGSAAENPGSAVEPKGPVVETEITSPIAKAKVEVVGTDQWGQVPFKAKLEKDKVYKIRISAPGFATLEQDVTGGADKVTAKLDPKPHTIQVTSEPAGALILVDGSPIGHSTPYEVQLTKAQAAKKAVRIGLTKGGFRPVTTTVDLSTFTEEDAKMTAKVEQKLAVQQVVVRPPPNNNNTGSGSGAGSGAGSGSATPTNGSGDGTGSATTPPPNPTGSGSGSTGTTGTTGGSAAEPVPDFAKP